MTKRAFLVAAEHYPQSESTSSELPGTIDATSRFARWLSEVHGLPDDNIFRCSSEDDAEYRTTRSGIIDAGHELICQSQGDRNGTEQLFVYVAGHGVTVTDHQDGHDIFLCSDFINPTRSGVACIDINEWIDWFARELGVGNHFWFVDACRTPVGPMNPTSLGIARSTAHRASANWFQLSSAAPGHAAKNDFTFVSSLLDALKGNCKLVNVPAQDGRFAVTFDNVAETVLETLRQEDRSGYSQASGDATDSEITTVIRYDEVETITKDGEKLPPVELLTKYDDVIFIGNTNGLLPQFLLEAFEHRDQRRWRTLEVLFIRDLVNTLDFRPDQTIDRLQAKRDAAQSFLESEAEKLAFEVRIYHTPYLGFFGSIWGNETEKRRAHITTAFFKENIRKTRSRDYIDFPDSRSPVIEEYLARVRARMADGAARCVFEQIVEESVTSEVSDDGSATLLEPLPLEPIPPEPPLLEPLPPDPSAEPPGDEFPAIASRPPIDPSFQNPAAPFGTELSVLENRFDQAFADRSLLEQLESERKIIGPRADTLVADAEAGREKLRRGERPTPKERAALEQAIRLRRPAPPCKANAPTRLPNNELFADVWVGFQSRLLEAQSSIARLERIDDPDAGDRGRLAVGTGFLVDEGLLVTAAHVVQALSRGPMDLEQGQAVADFRAYAGNAGHDRCDILGVAAFDANLDLAVLRFESSAFDPSVKCPFLSIEPPRLEFGTPIGVVGCPLEDALEQETFMRAVFSDYEFGVKRVAVGAVLLHDETRFAHDCSTLGGNSGSPVFDLASGDVVGIHVRGASLLRNEAVRGEQAAAFVEEAKQDDVFGVAPKVRDSRGHQEPDELREYVEDLSRRDPEIVREIGEMEESLWPLAIQEPRVARAIVMRTGRPVLDVRGGNAILDVSKIKSEVWTERLKNASALLGDNVPAVGRIELSNHPRGFEWIGTGWLLHSNIVVTNRHVVDAFGHERNGGFVFRPGLEPGPMKAHIDFLEEFDRDESHEFPLYKILHIEPEGGPDVAFLRVEAVRGQTLPSPVKLAEKAAAEGDSIAVIGYPARDPHYPDPEEMDRLFDYRYDKKRLAPGLVSEVTNSRVFHDCTTLGGNSGGEVVSLSTGEAVALHFAGTAFKRNHAIPARVVGDRLDDVLSGRARRSRPKPSPTPPDPAPKPQPPHTQVVQPAENAIVASASKDGVLEATIPIHLRIQLGKPDSNRTE